MWGRGTVGTFAMLALATPRAYADCPPTLAECLFQEQGSDALAARRFDDARAKFSASVAARPTARGYLGLAQALEGLGRTAAAYDAIVQAARLSAAELAAAPAAADDLRARDERIRYKLGELHGAVALVHLVLPPQITAEQLATVQRAGDGEVLEPLARPIAIAPGQRLDVTLRDGHHATIASALAAGAEGTALVVLDAPPPPPPAALPAVTAWLDIDYLISGDPSDHANNRALGGDARLEIYPRLRAGRRTRDLAVTARAGFLHDFEQRVDGLDAGLMKTTSSKAYEVTVLAGGVVGRGPVFAALELGAVVRHVQASVVPSDEPLTIVSTDLSLAATLAVGARWKRFDVRIGAEVGTNDLPTRFLFSVGGRLAPP